MLRSLVVRLADEEELPIRRNLPPDKLEEALAADDLVWVDGVDIEEEEILWLERAFQLHPAVVADLRRDDRRPSVLVYPDYLFLSLFQGRIGRKGVESDEIHMVIGEDYLITVRRASCTAVEGAYDRAAQSGDYWRRGVTYLLYLAMQFIIDSYYPLLDRISSQLNRLEESVMANGGGKDQQRQVYAIKQQLIHLRGMVAPQREVVSTVIGEDRLASTSEDRELFRHLYERMLRIYDVIDAQRDLAGNVLDLLRSQQSTLLTHAVNRLTVISMIFLPLTFLLSLFGLNFVTTTPELNIPLPGAVVFGMLVVITVTGAAVLAWFFRRRGWL